jgi:two-component system sensor histidine kinase BaeS
LDQVLGNLLANALRHTPTGGIITLRTQSVEDGVRIQVADSGQGIPAEDLPYIFDRFWRGDPSRPHGGSTGLGLAIAQQLIELPAGVRSY